MTNKIQLSVLSLTMIVLLSAGAGYFGGKFLNAPSEINSVVCSHTIRQSDVDAMLANNTISLTAARTEHNTYLNGQQLDINTRLNNVYGAIGQLDIEDNVEITFDIDILRYYLCYSEQIANLGTGDQLGIRIYFAAKADTRANNATLTKVFIVPAIKRSGSQVFVDIPGAKPLNYGSSGRPPLPY